METINNVYQERIERMNKLNEDVLKEEVQFLLKDEYIQALGELRVSQICSDYELAKRISRPAVKENLASIGKILDRFQRENNTDDWGTLFIDILDIVDGGNYDLSYTNSFSIKNYSCQCYLLEILEPEIIEELTDEMFQNLLFLISSKNIFNVEQIYELLPEHFSLAAEEKLNDKINSEDIKEKKEAILLSKFKLTLNEAEEMVCKYSNDIECIKDL